MIRTKDGKATVTERAAFLSRDFDSTDKNHNQIKHSNSNKVIYCIKILICALVLGVLLFGSYRIDLTPYYNTRDYNILNQFEKNEGTLIPVNGIKQTFVARGNILQKIYICYSGDTDENEKFYIRLFEDNNELYQKEFAFKDYTSGEYNVLDIGYDGLKRGTNYNLVITETGDNALIYHLSPEIAYTQTFLSFEANDIEYDGRVSVGFLFSYRYLNAGNLFHYLLNLFQVVILGLVLCYGILNIEKLVSLFQKKRERNSILYSLSLAILLCFSFNPIYKDKTAVTSFVRQMGAGYIAGYDASRVIRNFFTWFVIFAVSFIVFYLVVNAFLQKERNAEGKKVISFLNKVIIVCDVNIILRMITFFQDTKQYANSFHYSSYVLELILLFSVFYLAFEKRIKVQAITYYKALLVSFFVSLPITILIQTEWENGKFLLGVQTLMCLLAIFAVCCIPSVIQKIENNGFLHGAVVFSSAFPLLTALYIEGINVANQHSIFVSRIRHYYILLCATIFILFIGSCFANNKRRIVFKNWKKWTYVLSIIGIGLLSIIINLENYYTPDIFESANSSNMISGLLQFSKIPVVESVGHHMMESVWEGILYGFINNDFSGAIVSPYSGLVRIPILLLFFFFLKEIWDEDMAYWTTILLPLYGNYVTFGWGLLAVLSVCGFIKSPSVSKSFGIWISLVWLCLNRADLGLSFGIASFTTLVIWLISTRGWRKYFKTVFIPMIVVIAIVLTTWSVLCFAKGINPISRTKDFLGVFAASINWTYNGIGNTGNTVFAWSYMIIPFGVLVSLIYTICIRKKREEMGIGIWSLLMMLSIAYFANFTTRALTRHSLAEMQTNIVLWTGYFALSLFAVYIFHNRKLFIPFLMLFILCNTLFSTSSNFNEAAIADQASSKVGPIKEEWTKGRFDEEDRRFRVNGQVVTYWEKISLEREIKQRVHYTDGFERTIKPYGEILGVLLKDNDTFLDFIWNSFLYSAYNLDEPVYIAQSPTMLNGEDTQKAFLDQIQGYSDKIPIALMPNQSGYHDSMDGIMLNYKYYIVAEYIYKHYRPLCDYSNFSVWCLNERYDEMKEKLITSGLLDQGDWSLIDWDFEQNRHNYSLNMLPLYWGEYDSRKSYNNSVVIGTVKNEDQIFVFDPMAMQESDLGNYVQVTTNYLGADMNGKTGNEDETIDAVLTMGYYENDQMYEIASYLFTVKEGQHTYLFRVSSDYNWLLKKVNSFVVKCREELQGINIQILQGD